MQAPVIEPGKRFKIYFEVIDPILINALHPQCFVCAGMIEEGTKVVTLKALTPLRMELPCFELFLQGLAMFTMNGGKMKTFKTDIQ